MGGGERQNGKTGVAINMIKSSRLATGWDLRSLARYPGFLDRDYEAKDDGWAASGHPGK